MLVVVLLLSNGFFGAGVVEGFSDGRIEVDVVLAVGFENGLGVVVGNVDV